MHTPAGPASPPPLYGLPRVGIDIKCSAEPYQVLWGGNTELQQLRWNSPHVYRVQFVFDCLMEPMLILKFEEG